MKKPRKNIKYPEIWFNKLTCRPEIEYPDGSGDYFSSMTDEWTVRPIQEKVPVRNKKIRRWFEFICELKP